MKDAVWPPDYITLVAIPDEPPLSSVAGFPRGKHRLFLFQTYSSFSTRLWFTPTLFFYCNSIDDEAGKEPRHAKHFNIMERETVGRRNQYFINGYFTLWWEYVGQSQRQI
jgi:hypothetical protein